MSKTKQIAQEALRRFTEHEERSAAGLGLGDVRVKEWKEAHLARMEARTASGDAAASTLQRSQEAMAHFTAWLEADHREISRISQISPGILRDYQLSRGVVRAGLWSRRARAKTVNTEMSLLSPAFREALRDGILRANPMDGVRKLKEKDSRPALELSSRQVALLLRACREEDPGLLPYLLGYAYTGARRGELFAVQWSDVDFHGKTLRIQNLKTHRDASDRSRPVPLHPKVAAALRKRGHLRQPWPEINDQSLRNRFIRVAKAAKMPWLTRLHDLRHAFAGALVTSGTDLYVVGKLLGHRDPATTTRYAHLQPEALKRAVSKLRF